MKENPIVFNDLVAQNYDDYLGSFIFEPFAVDLVERIDKTKATTVLELACGTGRVTKHISEQLTHAKFTATDLNPGMIAVAKQRVLSPELKWEVTDMSNIQFDDNQFDLVICQFGVMFAPDKIKALTEIHRVLKKGGTLIFNTWGDINNNKVFQITSKVVNSFLGDNATTIFADGPFCMSNEKNVLQLLEQSGFNENKVTVLDKIGQIETAGQAAKGCIEGLPVFAVIQNKVPSSLPAILNEVENEFIKQFGNKPVKASMQALVFQSTK